MRRQPRIIRSCSSITTQKRIVPFMNLSMAVGKCDRAGFVMIDGRTIARTAGRENKKKTIIKRQRVFIRENHAI